tara:strand:- start:97 stop:423 length:327 start_codon:yes stop_codon:yes gene_type:complete
MSWTLKVKHTRPNTGVNFYKDSSGGGKYMSPSAKTHVKNTYVDTGKRISFTTSLSGNQLELTKTYVFSNETAKNEYVNDSVIQSWLSDCNTYNTANGISKVILQNEAT